MDEEARGARDDLGERLLAEHPRGDHWRQLDVTVAALTFDQLDRLAHQCNSSPGAAAARERLITGVGDTELAGRLGSRWVRWADMFSIPQPDTSVALDDVLAHPYRLLETGDVDRDYLSGVLAVFDAGLGIAAAGSDDTGAGDYELLTAPWRAVCLPSRFTPTTAYGPHTQPGLALLHRARSAGPLAAKRLLAARGAVDPQQWSWARDQVAAAGLACGFPFRSRALFWEAVPAAEHATDRSPTDPALPESLWAAAATLIFADHLPDPAASILTEPWLGSGQTL